MIDGKIPFGKSEHRIRGCVMYTMEYQQIIEYIFNCIINQSIIDRKNQWDTLPSDQELLLTEMLDAVHTLCENSKIVATQYKNMLMRLVC